MKLISLYFLLILALGCNKNDNESIGPDSDSDPGIEKGLLEDRKINVSGIERNYHLYIPQNPTNAPVVMLLHGNKSNNDEILGITGVKAPYKIWLDVAEQENIILIIPNGSEGSSGNNGWNDCRSDAEGNPDSSDVLFTSNLIDFVLNEYQANASKVFAVGTSNGGHMATRLAQEIPNKLKAFASIVASNPVNSQCTNSTIPISALIINGTDDPFLPYEGGQMVGNRGEVHSAQETIDYWVSRNQTATMAVVTDFQDIDTTDKCTVKKHLYINGANNTEVAFYEVIDGGHAEPSIAQRYSNLAKVILGEQNGDIEMANEVWGFFKNK